MQDSNGCSYWKGNENLPDAVKAKYKDTEINVDGMLFAIYL
jgi:hypothetical protein